MGAIGDHYADAATLQLRSTYADAIAELESRGIENVDVEHTGGNVYALEGGAGLATDGEPMYLSAGNALPGLLSVPADARRWAVTLRDVDTSDVIGSGIADTLAEAVRNVFVSHREHSGTDVDTSTGGSESAEPFTFSEPCGVSDCHCAPEPEHVHHYRLVRVGTLRTDTGETEPIYVQRCECGKPLGNANGVQA